MNKSDVLKKVGQKIKEIRLKKEMTQVELTARMEVTTDPNNISRLEAGRTNPTLFTLYRISEALEVPLSDLVNMSFEEK